MPKIEGWSRLPQAVRQHLIERFADRRISTLDIAALQAWIASSPDVPDGPWYKDFRSFKICGEGKYPKTFLLAGQAAKGTELK
ncbi:MAG: hypothetical protein ACRD3Q_12880 [Terriglobales bacterium]